MNWTDPLFLSTLILIGALFVDICQRWAFGRALKLKICKTISKKSMVEALTVPLSLALWTLALSLLSQLAPALWQEKLGFLIPILRKCGFALAGTWFFIRLIGRIKQHLLHKTPEQDASTLDALARMAQILVVVIATLIIFQSFGLSLSGLLAFGGVGGIAVGFAAKDLLANLFGACLLYLDRPFKVGDHIEISDKSIDGYVEHISWRITTIRSLEKRPIYVPNSLFTLSSLTNISRMSHRRIKQTLALRLDDLPKLTAICHDIERMIATHPDIDKKQAIIARLDTFDNSQLNVYISCFSTVKPLKDFYRVKHEVLLLIYESIENHGAELASPVSRITLEATKGIPLLTP
jgi:MscS family membrane protein